MENSIKFYKAIQNLKAGAEYISVGDVPTTEELFNQVDWKTGEDENQQAITTKVNPHTELTWSAVNAEMARLETEYDAQDYARKRKAEYPSIEELVVALYDAEDKTAVDEKRAAVKAKYSKP